MPDFGDFNYFFAIDVLHISLFEIGIGTVIVGVVVIAGPIFYQKYCANSEYQKLFFGAQAIHII